MRLFAGIELDEAARALCVDAQSRLQRAAFEAKYEAPEKLHVTLAFLGNVRDDLVPEVEDVLAAVGARTPAFELRWDRMGAFPNERRPRIAYVGSRNQGAPFRLLAHALHDEYRRIGFDFKEDPVAHVTLARVKGGSKHPLPQLDIPTQIMPVREIALFESFQAATTTRYEIRHRAPLSGA